MEARILKEEDFRMSRWSGGVTKELFIYPEGSAYAERDFFLRISSATVDLETANFTPLEGFHRWITPLEGELSLEGDHGTRVDLSPYEVHDFSGSEKIKSRGKVTDFNLMVKEGQTASLRVIRAKVQEEVAFELSESDLLALYLPAGEALVLKGIPGGPLKAGELLIVEGVGRFSFLATMPSRIISCRIEKNPGLS